MGDRVGALVEKFDWGVNGLFVGALDGFRKGFIDGLSVMRADGTTVGATVAFLVLINVSNRTLDEQLFALRSKAAIVKTPATISSHELTSVRILVCRHSPPARNAGGLKISTR